MKGILHFSSLRVPFRKTSNFNFRWDHPKISYESRDYESRDYERRDDERRDDERRDDERRDDERRDYESRDCERRHYERRHYQPILGYIPKNYERQNSGSNGLSH